MSCASTLKYVARQDYLEKTGIQNITGVCIFGHTRRGRSLKKIISALSLALLPVLNVFLILFLLMGICELTPFHPRTLPSMAERVSSSHRDRGLKFAPLRRLRLSLLKRDRPRK